jgi:tetratricopeptide (TPR) repeat protein
VPRDLNGLILQGRYAEFEALSRQYEDKFKSDPKYETALVRLYDGLDSEAPVMAARLVDWVGQHRSHIALAARGIYLTHRGFSARGDAFAARTPAERMQRMAQLHLQAASDLLAALKEDDGFALAYRALIQIAQARGDTVTAERVMNEAVRKVPQTYYVRFAYLSALQPNWGGDYSLMREYADTLDDAAKLNPRIWSLKAEVPAAMAHSAWRSRDYSQAIRYYTEALSFGDRTAFLRNRGMIYLEVKDYARARADFARYLEYVSDPEVRKYLQRLPAGR